MKILFTLLGGLALVVTLYGAGFVTAITFLDAEPVATWKPGRDAAQAWTLEPVRVEDGESDLQRLPARTRAPSLVAAAEEMEQAADGSQLSIDTMTTAALAPDEAAAAATEPEPEPAFGSEHVRWCEARYRSYRAEDNSYRPFSGGTRPCVSPYSGMVEAARDGNGEGRQALAVADARRVQRAEPGLRRALTIGHVRACAQRYRSYRVSDNSYQPYGGGPRRQCE